MINRMKTKIICPYADDWKNEEGWLVTDDGKLVCLDWDDYCTGCRVDDSSDYVFTVDKKATKK